MDNFDMKFLGRDRPITNLRRVYCEIIGASITNWQDVKIMPSAKDIKEARHRKMDFLPPSHDQESTMPMFIELRSMFFTPDEGAWPEVSRIMAFILAVKRNGFDYTNLIPDIGDALTKLLFDIKLFTKLGLENLESTLFYKPEVSTEHSRILHGNPIVFKEEDMISEFGSRKVIRISNSRNNVKDALKTIRFKRKLMANPEETLKEIELHTKLSHLNIVAFKGAWGNSLGYMNIGCGAPIPKMKRLDYCYLVLPDTGADIKLYTNDSAEEPTETHEYELMYRLCIRMELCDGSLDERIEGRNKNWFKSGKRLRVLDEEHMFGELEIFGQILKGVEYLHAKKIIHRDLKPSNILLGKDKRWKIADFGLSCTHGLGDRDIDKPRNAHAEDIHHTSRQGAKAYRAPECQGKYYDSKADMFSLGVILVDLLYPVTWTNKKRLDKCKMKLLVQLDRKWSYIAEQLRSLNPRKKKKLGPENRPSATELLRSELFSNKPESSGVAHDLEMANLRAEINNIAL